MIELLVSVIVAAVVGFVVGWRVREAFAMQRVENYRQMMQQQSQAISKVNIRIERDRDMFYVFNADTQEFLAQGQSHQQIEEILRRRFAKTLFLASDENLDEVGYKK